MDDLRVRNNWTYLQMAQLVTDAARAAGQPYSSFDRHTIRNAISGRLPRSETLAWMATAWRISVPDMASVVETHRSWRIQHASRRPTAPEHEVAQPAYSAAGELTTAITSDTFADPSDSLSKAERAAVADALHQNIDSAWRLFHTTHTERMAAIGRAQLYMLKLHRSVLDARVLPSLYSTTYRLVGAVSHRRGHYRDALEAHDRAYLAALEGGDAWNMAESRTWQAYAWKALGRYEDTQLSTDAAMRLVSESSDTASVRLRARLLASSAENASLLGDYSLAYERLAASQALLDQLPERGEEFDKSAWLESAGVCALHLGRVEEAIDMFRQALDSLPADWMARRIFTTVGLAGALAKHGDKLAAMEVARTAIPALRSIQATELTRHFVHSLNSALPESADDDEFEAFVAESNDALTADD